MVPAFETIRTVTVPPKGTAVLAVYRLLAALRQVSPDERADVLELLEVELAETIA